MPTTDRRMAENLRALEYIVLGGRHGGGSVEVAASNRVVGGASPRPHRSGTPTDAEWSESALLAAVDPVWGHLAELFCVLGGWDRARVVEGRVGASGAPERTSLCRAVESGLPVGHAEWCGFTALLHLRNWQSFRDADDGYFDLYVLPDADPHGATYSVIENDPMITAKLASMTAAIRIQVTRVMQALLPDPVLIARLDAVGVGAPEPMWEDETMPVYGGGAYHWRFVAM